jgi:hypothetical protein
VGAYLLERQQILGVIVILSSYCLHQKSYAGEEISINGPDRSNLADVPFLIFAQTPMLFLTLLEVQAIPRMSVDTRQLSIPNCFLLSVILATGNRTATMIQAG